MESVCSEGDGVSVRVSERGVVTDEHYCSLFWYVVLCLHSESFNSHTAHACFLFDNTLKQFTAQRVCLHVLFVTQHL